VTVLKDDSNGFGRDSASKLDANRRCGDADAVASHRAQCLDARSARPPIDAMPTMPAAPELPVTIWMSPPNHLCNLHKFNVASAAERAPRLFVQ
jgi:hypothetical protein